MLVPDAAMATGERLKVLDFGLAKLALVREAAFVKTQSQAVMGTPLYMSPEQCEGAGHVDVKTDVYALGCMLYEMLSGRPPFIGDGPGQVIGQHLFKNAEPLGKLVPELPDALTELVDRLLVKAKDERPSMRDTRKALEVLVPTLPVPRRRESADPSGAMSPELLSAMGMASTLGNSNGESSARGSKKTRLVRLGIGAFLIVVILGSFWAIRRALLPRLTPATVAAVAPLTPKQVTTRVDSEPSGALVLDASGTELGKTPWQRQSEPRPGTQELTLRLAGHSDKSVSINLSSDDHTSVALTPAQAASTSRSKSGSHSSKKPVLKRIKKFARDIADKLKSKPAEKNADKSATKNKSR